jgi:hypothetical protein
MLSRFNSKCRLCGQSISKGDTIAKRDGIWAHDVCPDAAPVRIAAQRPTRAQSESVDFSLNDWDVPEVPQRVNPESKPGFVLSQYQRDAIDALNNTTSNLVIIAVAGSGKSTLEQIMLYHVPAGKRSVYLAFNKSIRDEFKERKAPEGAEVYTTHSLGLRLLTQKIGRAKLDENKTYKMLDSIAPIPSDAYGEELSAIKHQRKIITQLVSLCKATLTDSHSIDALQVMADRYNIDLNGDASIILPLVGQALDASDSETRIIDFDDMLYLAVKFGYAEQYDYVFVDEAQDLNATQIKFILSLVTGGGRIIAVGDEKQCQPADTTVSLTGGVNRKIDQLTIGDEVVSYERHGAAFVGRVNQGRKVNAIAHRHYDGPMLTVKAAYRSTRCTPNHKWMVRFSNREPNHYVVYMMRKGNNFRVGWCQLFQENGILHLAQRARIEKADCAWILKACDTKAEASIYESIVAYKFGLPTIMFQPANGTSLYTTQAIKHLFDSVPAHESFSRAMNCLEAHGRMIEYPFYNKAKQARQGRTTIFETQACNLISGLMSVPVYTGTRDAMWSTIEIETKYYSGEVYSLDIDIHHKYVADGLLTCNSIYGFRGADTDAMPRLIEALSATTLPLSITYRCPKAHVTLAQTLVPQIMAADSAPEGSIEYIQFKDFNPCDGDLCLSRINAALVGPAFTLIRAGRKAIIRGRDIGANLAALADKLAMRCADMASMYTALAKYDSSERSRLDARHAPDSQYSSLDDKVQTLDVIMAECESPCDVSKRILSIFSDESTSGVLFSSVHRAKGLEAETVYILAPEKLPLVRANQQEHEKQQELNICYVAYTRSKARLVFVETQRRG